MTFETFCIQYDVTARERRELAIYLGSLRAARTIGALLKRL